MSVVLKLTLAFVASVLIFFLTVIFVLNPLMKWQTENKPPVGASDNDHFIRVQGLKPIDAQVTATAIFYGGGEECRSFFWSASDGKKRQGAKAVFKIEHNFSPVPDRYELRIPYKNYQASGCEMTLWQINVGAKNAFDDVGFADLRIYPPRMESDKVIGPHSLIEAKNCRARYYDDLQEWSSGLACSFFVDDKMRDKKSDLVIFNAYSVYLNFLQFDDETTIYYDILAGENYRSVPLESKMDE